MTIFFDKRRVARVDDVLALYPAREFESPTRSTVPLLSLLKHGNAIWGTVVRNLSLVAQSLEVHLEFTVKPVRGEGKPSHTDMMLIGNGSAVAVEAKWTEPPYSTVDEWVRKGANPENRKAVMRGWLCLLRQHAARELRLEDFGGVTYQMVHRAASACATGQKPSLAYLQFSPLANGVEPDITQLQTRLSHLYGLLGAPPAFPFSLIEVRLKPTDAFHRIGGLPKGSPETAKRVHAVLVGAPLFEFTSARAHPIQNKQSL